MSDVNSDSNSFIDEVNEEIRRDRLFAMLRRYGWIGVVVILALVGGTAYVEWQKTAQERAAQALGDAILAAQDLDDPAQQQAQLSQIAQDTANNPVVLFLLAQGELAQSEIGNDQWSEALPILESIANNSDLPERQRELAQLKQVMLAPENILSADDKESILSHLARPGAPYRNIATELQAFHLIAQGQTEQAVEILQTHLQDAEITPDQQRRITELLIVLGINPALENTDQ